MRTSNQIINEMQQCLQNNKPLPSIPFPPGLSGDLYRYIRYNNPRSVREIEIAAMLGLLAAICGRAYRTFNNADLALYIILVAPSGRGKDYIHNIIPKLLSMTENPSAMGFISQDLMASPQALLKNLNSNPGILWMKKEFGHLMKEMAIARIGSPAAGLRAYITEVYNSEIGPGIKYSDDTNSVAGVGNPALSIIGETTPGRLLECLTTEMGEDGFLSRFLIITYEGMRVGMDVLAEPHPLGEHVLESLKNIVSFATPFQKPIFNIGPRKVDCNGDVYEQYREFEKICDDKINEAKSEIETAAWNRASLKALKIASLLAVLENPNNPVINGEHYEWALCCVLKDVFTFLKNLRNGDIGIDDSSRRLKIMEICSKYLVTTKDDKHTLCRRKSVITRDYIQTRTAKLKPFEGFSGGATKAMDLTLKDLIDSGYLVELDKVKDSDLRMECGLMNARGFRMVKSFKD